MKSGDMLRRLSEELRQLPIFLDDPKHWTSLDVDYEPPRVERLWRQSGDVRVLLHRIHPCEDGQALFHPHPWPSAVMLVSGSYVMGLGSSDSGEPPEIATVILPRRAWYEMIDPKGWHYVRPLERPSLSVMITGAPYADRHANEKRPVTPLKPLSFVEVDALLRDFRWWFGENAPPFTR